jgi:hypothetical protein
MFHRSIFNCDSECKFFKAIENFYFSYEVKTIFCKKRFSWIFWILQYFKSFDPKSSTSFKNSNAINCGK